MTSQNVRKLVRERTFFQEQICYKVGPDLIPFNPKELLSQKKLDNYGSFASALPAEVENQTIRECHDLINGRSWTN